MLDLIDNEDNLKKFEASIKDVNELDDLKREIHRFTKLNKAKSSNKTYNTHWQNFK